MTEKKNDIEEKKGDSKNKKSLGKLLLIISGYTVLFTFVLLVSAYFLFDRIVKLTIEDQFNSNSKGRYEMKIKSLKTNLFNESVLIKGLEINPIGNYADSIFRIENQLNVVAFDIATAQLTIRDAKRFLLTDSLTISSFGVDTVQIKYWNYKASHDKKDPRDQIQQLISKLTPDLLLDSFAIHHASLDFYTSKAPKSFEHHIADFAIDLEQIQINDDVSKSNLFFTPQFQIQVKNYVFQDSIHELEVKKVVFDSRSKSINVENILFDKGDKANLKIPLVRVQSPQVANYIYNKKLILDSLIVSDPEIQLSGISHNSSTSRSIKESLQEVVSKFTEELQINNISIVKADLDIERMNEAKDKSLKFDVDNLSFVVDGIHINEENIDNYDRIMFSEDIKLSFDQFNFFISKQNANVHVGQFETNIRDEYQMLRDIAYEVPNSVDLKISSISLHQMNWQKFWDKSEVELNSFGVKNPRVVMYTDKSKKKGRVSRPQNLSELIVKTLPFEISLNKLYVKNGLFKQYFSGSTKGIKSQSAKNVNLVLNDIHFDRDQELKNPIQAILGDVEYLKFGHYKLKPVNGNFDLDVQGVELYPKSKDFHIDNIALDFKGQMDLQISSFNFINLDWEAYLKSNSINVQKVWIENPHIIADFDKKNKDKQKPKFDIKKLLPEVLLGFGSQVNIDSVQLTDGDLNIRTEAKNVFKQNVDSLDILITGFKVDSNYSQSEHLLYSDDIAVSFENYSIEKDSSLFKFLVHDVVIPSRDSLIVFHDLNFRSENGDTIHSPRLELRDIDWNKLWDNDTLVVDFVLLDSLTSEWTIGKKQQGGVRKNLDTKLNIPVIMVNELAVVNGTANFTQPGFGFHDIKQFDVNINGVLIDSNKMSTGLPCDNLAFNANSYKLKSDKHDLDITVDKVSGNTKDGDLRIADILIKNHELDIETEELFVKGFNTDRLLLEKTIAFNTVDVNKTKVHYIKSSHFNRIKNLDTVPFTQKLFSVVNGIYGNSFNINDLSLSAMLPQTMHSFDSLYTSFRDISVSPPDLKCEDRILCSRGVSTSFKNYSYLNQHKLQQIHFKAIEASSMDSTLLISDLQYSPTLEESEFLDNLRHRKTFFSVNSKEMSSNSFNFYELYNSQKLLVRNMVIESPEMMVAENLKKSRVKGKVPIMPNQMVRELPMYMKIDEIEVHKADIVYNERSRNFKGTGSVYFTDTDVHIENVTNDPVYMNDDNPTVIRAHTQFMDEGSLSILMKVPLLADSFSCEYQGTLGAMNAKIINEMLVPNANLGLRSGEVRRISFNAEVNNGVAKGEMLAKYRSFKVDIYSKNQKRRTIVGSLISNMVISKNNKKKKGKIYYESTPVDSFIKVLWGGIRSGLKDTLLPGFVVNKV